MPWNGAGVSDDSVMREDAGVAADVEDDDDDVVDALAAGVDGILTEAMGVRGLLDDGRMSNGISGWR